MPPPTDAPALRLKGNYFARPDFFLTDVGKGVTRTPAGQRVCALPGDFLLGFRDAALYECGKAYRPVLKSAGRRWGATFAKRFDKELAAFYAAPLGSLAAPVVHTCLADAFAYYGYGRLVVDLSARDAGLTLVELFDPVMPALVREADRPVDLIMAGMLGAVFAHLTGQPLDAVQTDCPTLGADRSRFVVGPADRVAEAEAWMDAADRLPGHEAVVRRLQRATPAAAAADQPADPAPVAVSA